MVHGKFRASQQIPMYGQVKVISPPDEFGDIAGDEGVILGGGKLDSGEYTYTVLMLSKRQTYYLAGSALAFTGVVVRKSDIYSTDSMRVVVDEVTGEGRIVGRSNREAKGT
jgi:hypothetical protein